MSNKVQEKVQFSYLYPHFSLKNRAELKKFIHRIVRREGQTVEHLNFIFCSDDYLLNINRTYLKHDYFTDIITFTLAPEHQPLLSDIYISIERVKENARLFKSTFTKELHRVIFHGALHLCGYKDKTKVQERLMRKLEDKYLSAYFVSRGKT